MANRAASVREKLLQLAKARSLDFQLVLIRYALERVLYRLSMSDFSELYVLKGAMLLQVWNVAIVRPTRDLDLLGFGDSALETVGQQFKKICLMDMKDEDGLAFDPESLRAMRIKEEADYQGVRVHFLTYLGTARIPVQIDVGFGDVVTPKPLKRGYPTLLKMEPPNIQMYPGETVIAEKFQAMVYLGLTNSRMKDYWDLWSLISQFNFAAHALLQALYATCERRETPFPKELPVGLTQEFTTDDRKQKQWAAFLKKSGLVSGSLSLTNVISLLGDFFEPLLGSTVDANMQELVWQAEENQWKPS
jgi:predicted nucleotidyltransferase component of viral defense system